MSIRSRIAGLAGLLGATGVAAALTEKDKERVLFVDGVAPPVKTPKAATKPTTKQTPFERWAARRLERVRYFSSYKGGKHRRGVPPYIMQGYATAAQAKRDRKNAKRYIDHSFAQIQNPCVKFN